MEHKLWWKHCIYVYVYLKLAAGLEREKVEGMPNILPNLQTV
jgi:hypothetical protein